jgi:hypothetical protein
MVFDFTHGKEPKYVVHINSFNEHDRLIYSNYEDALKKYNSVPYSAGQSIGIYEYEGELIKGGNK